jgi:putative allergen V5/tpx-1 related protein
MNYLRNSLSGGKADVAYAYGRATDTAVAGDWDADGKDSVWVRRGNVLYVRDVLQGGDADLTLAYGRATDKLIVGDWEKDKTDTIGLVRQ